MDLAKSLILSNVLFWQLIPLKLEKSETPVLSASFLSARRVE
jgi:hypothetical protein